MAIETADATHVIAPPTRPGAEVLRRADGVELIGEFEGSGFKDPPLLARRADGQVVQLTKLLYAVAEGADGDRDLHEIGDVVSRRCGRTVTASNIAVLAERKLRPLGVLALADGTTPVLKKRPPVMALRHRKPLLSEAAVNAGARAFTWMHFPIVTAAVLLALGAFDVWLFGVHGIAGALRSALYNPPLLLAVFASVVVATAFHEFGHASACRYGGARPGVMGIGLYLVWPVFYCDVTDAYRLNRTGRLRTDLGGVYFNAISALLAGLVFLVSGEEAALLVAFVQHMIILQQLIPLMRFDGYYVLTDLTGVPDILSRIKPIFRSLLRGRDHEPRVAELKPWVRVIVTTYIVTLIPALLLLFTWMLMATPRLVSTVYDSFGLQLRHLGHAGLAETALGALRTTLLALQIGAIALSLARAGRLAGRHVIRWSRGNNLRTAVAAIGAAALVAAAGYILWPNHDYRPIGPGDRGTVQDGLNSLTNLAGGPGVSGYAHDPSSQDSPKTGTGTDTYGMPTRAASSRGAGTGDTTTSRTTSNKGTATATSPTTGTSTPTTTNNAATGTTTSPTTTSPTTTSPTTTSPTTTNPTTTNPTTTNPTTTGTTTTPTTTGTTTGKTSAGAGGGNSSAVAVNTTDNSFLFKLTFAIFQVTRDVVDNQNVAEAYASCSACETVAISIQTLLIAGSPTTIAPINVASSLNQNCNQCDTLALAYQFVIGIGTRLKFTATGREQIAEIRRQLEMLGNAGLTGPQIQAAVNALMTQYASVLATQLVPVSQPTAGAHATGTSSPAAGSRQGGTSTTNTAAATTPPSTASTSTSPSDTTTTPTTTTASPTGTNTSSTGTTTGTTTTPTTTGTTSPTTTGTTTGTTTTPTTTGTTTPTTTGTTTSQSTTSTTSTTP